MNSNQKAVYKSIDEILSNDWDPIGVNTWEVARDEYQSYVPEILSLKMQGADRDIIAKKLFEIATVKMSVYGNIDHCYQIADKIIDVK